MLIGRLTIKNLLSFIDTKFDLGGLNVLIGANAVGKSNFIEVLSLLQAAPASLAGAIQMSGGMRQWLWLGGTDSSPVAMIDCELNLRRGRQVGPLEYHIEFSEEFGGLVILHEQLAKSVRKGRNGGPGPYFVRDREQTEFWPAGATTAPAKGRVPLTESVFSQFKNPSDETPIT